MRKLEQISTGYWGFALRNLLWGVAVVWVVWDVQSYLRQPLYRRELLQAFQIFPIVAPIGLGIFIIYSLLVLVGSVAAYWPLARFAPRSTRWLLPVLTAAFLIVLPSWYSLEAEGSVWQVNRALVEQERLGHDPGYQRSLRDKLLSREKLGTVEHRTYTKFAERSLTGSWQSVQIDDPFDWLSLIHAGDLAFYSYQFSDGRVEYPADVQTLVRRSATGALQVEVHARSNFCQDRVYRLSYDSQLGVLAGVMDALSPSSCLRPGPIRSWLENGRPKAVAFIRAD